MTNCRAEVTLKRQKQSHKFDENKSIKPVNMFSLLMRLVMNIHVKCCRSWKSRFRETMFKTTHEM